MEKKMSYRPGLLEHAFNPALGEAEADRLLQVKTSLVYIAHYVSTVVFIFLLSVDHLK